MSHSSTPETPSADADVLNVNNDPTKYFCKNDKEVVRAQDVLFIDMSGSQGGSIKFLVELFDQIRDNTHVVCFGHYGPREYVDGYQTTGISGRDFKQKVSVTSKCSLFCTVTFIWEIDQSLKNMSPDLPVNFVFLGDGAFDDSFADMIRNHIGRLVNVKNFTILFSPHTRAFVMDRLIDELSEILKLCPSYINFNTQLLKNTSQLSEMYARFDQEKSFATPPGYYAIGDHMVHQLLRPCKVAEVLKERPELTVTLIAKLKQSLEKTPGVFLIENVYSKLYAALKILKDWEYLPGCRVQTELLDWISLRKGQLQGSRTYNRQAQEQYEALQRLINDSFQDRADTAWLESKIAQSCVGYLKVDEVFVKKHSSEEVQQAIRDSSGFELYALVRRMMCHFSYEPRQDDQTAVPSTWIPLVDPEDDACTAQLARITLSQLFRPWGQFVLSGRNLYLALMTLMTENVELHTQVRRLAERAILDDSQYTRQRLQYHEEKIDDSWFSPAYAGRIYRLMVLHGDRMFDDAAVRQELQRTFYTVYWVHHLRKIVRGFDKLLKRTSMKLKAKDSYREIGVGDVCWVDHRSFTSEGKTIPWTNVPAVVVVREIGRHHRLKCQYLDGSFMGDDECYRIFRHYLQRLTRMDQDKQDALHLMLSGWRNGEPVHTEENKVLKAERHAQIKSFLVEQCDMEWVEVRECVPLNLELVCRLIGLNEPQLREKVVQRSCKRADIESLLHLDASAFRLRPPPFEANVYAGKFELTDEDFQLVWRTFQREFYEQNQRIEGSRPTVLVTCSICASVADPSGAVRAACGHSLCLDCHQHLRQVVADTRYAPGDTFRDPYLYRCALCCHGWQVPGYAELDLDGTHWWARHVQQLRFQEGQVYRFCSDCRVLFNAGDQQCQANSEDSVDQLPSQCTQCREDLFFECPQCERRYQHDGGCRLMRCCPLGFHGCPEDQGEECDHQGLGCGHVFDIDPAQALIGNA